MTVRSIRIAPIVSASGENISASSGLKPEGRGEGVMEDRRGRVKSRNVYKGPMDKDNRGGERLKVGGGGGWSRRE